MGIAIMTLLNSGAIASDEPKKELTRGTWVVESNPHKPNVSIIRIYNGQNELVYEEEVKGDYVRASKKMQRKLNRIQEAIVNKKLISNNL